MVNLGASGDYQFGGRLAAVGSVLSVILAAGLPAGTVVSDASVAKDIAVQPTSSAQQRDYRRIIQATWPQLGTKAVTAVVASLYQAVSPIILKDQFKVTPATMGLAMSVQAIMNAIVGGFGLGPLTAAFAESYIVSACLLGLAVGFGGLVPASLTTSHWPWVGLGVVLSVLGHTLATVLTSQSTARVGPDEKGTLLGLEHGLFSAARICTPAGGVALLRAGGPIAISVMCAAISTAVWIPWGLSSGAARNLKAEGKNL